MNQSQAQIMAQAIYEIRVLLAGYLGSQCEGDPLVRQAAHLSYALHNEALAVLEGRGFDESAAISKIQAVDELFNQDQLAPIFRSLAEKGA